MVLKKVLTILTTTTVILVVLVTSLGVTACAGDGEIPPPYGYQTPAPESHDGDPESSGFDGIAGSEDSPGPVPNSVDGDPDGSGF